MFHKVCHVDFSLCQKLEMIVWFVKYWRSLQAERLITFLFGYKDSHIQYDRSDFQFSKMPLSPREQLAVLSPCKGSLWLWLAFLPNATARWSGSLHPSRWAPVLLISSSSACPHQSEAAKALPTLMLSFQGKSPDSEVSVFTVISSTASQDVLFWSCPITSTEQQNLLTPCAAKMPIQCLSTETVTSPPAATPRS